MDAGLAGRALALNIAVEQVIPLNGAPSNAEGVAVIRSGPNAGIYVSHRSDSQVTVLDVNTGAFLFNFDTTIPAGFNPPGMRAIDVLPNGNLIIGQHTTNLVREAIIPPKPLLSSTVPIATLGTLSFTVPNHLSPNQPFAEFESISAFARPSDGQVYLLLGEEGRDVVNPATMQLEEVAGEVYIGRVLGAGITDFSKLFSVPFADNYDDLSGLDLINVVFDGTGALDLGQSRVMMTDDSSGDESGAFVLDLFGQVPETLDGAGGGTLQSFETYFDPDGNGPEVARITIFFGTGADGTPAIVTFDSVEFEAAPEPSLVGLVALTLGALVVRRKRS